MSSSIFTKWFQTRVKKQHKAEENAQTFILEPIYTPSGLVDGGDDGDAIEVSPIDDLEDLSENTEEAEAIDSTDPEETSNTEDTSDPEETSNTEDSSDTLDTTDASHISDEDIGEDIPFVGDETENEDTPDVTAEEPVAAETTTEDEVEDDATEEVVAEEESSQDETSEETVAEESESSTDDETSEETVAEESESSEDDANEEPVAEESDTSKDDSVENETSQEPVAEDNEEADEEADEETVAEDEELDQEDEEILDETPKYELPAFNSGVFTVGESGEVGVDFLYDGGKYRGEVAIFSLAGLDKLEFETVEDFIAEAANRASSNSELGHIVISDPSEGARFNGSLEGGEDWNSGSYKGVKTVNMKAGEKFGVMLVPNGRVSEVANNPEIGGTKRPLFSLSTANPDDEFHIGQIADVTGDGNTFVMEDMRADGSSDKDYNDLIFQIRGAKGQATYIGNVINSNNDWRTEDMGKALLAYSEPYITPDPVQIDLTEAVETELDVTEEGEDATVDETAEETSETTAENSDESVVTEEEVDSEAVVEETAVEETESEAEVSRPVVDTSETVEETVSDTEVEVTETVEETENSTTEPADNSDTTDVVEESVTEVEAVNESQLEVTETVDAVEENQGSNSSEPEFPKEDQPDIGVIDTGFAANNPDLNDDNITQGTDVVDGDDNPFVSEGEGNEHGTHILGIIAAEQDNGEGIDGINDDAPIWVGRAVGSGKWAESLVEFVDHAKESDQPNAVANLSFDLTQVDADGNVTTRYEFTPQEREAIEYARQNGVLLVVAAGNNADVMSVLGQASQEFDNILTVGAAEQFDPDTSVWKGAGRTEYSSYGRGLDVMAYGGTPENPELSLTGDGLGTMAGSSVATAKVTGAVSQVWAANPELSYRQVIEIVKDTATDLGATGRDLETGAGLVNMTAAVLLAKATKPEEYDPAEFLIPNTWGGEGKVTASERAAKSASFSGTVDSGADYATVYLAPNREVSPSDSIQAMKDAGTRKGATLQFDAWEHDTVSSKIKYWYRIKGTNYWVADTAISGEPDVENLGSGSSSSGSSMSSSGNKFATAIDLGTISGSQSGNSGWVSDRDTKDYYKFRIDSRKRVEIELYGMSDDANLKLYNSSYSTIEESENGGSRDERISEVLEPGTYYIRVKQDNDGDNTSYRLRISAENVATPTNTSQSNSVQIGGYIVETPIYPIYQQNRAKLGNPTANQYNSSRGSVVQKFDRGRVVSSPQGNFALFDKIADWYGFTGNIVGLPIGEEFIDSNGYRHQLFENGGIYYNPSQGQPTAYQYGTAADPGVNPSSGSSQTSQTPPQTPATPPSNTPNNNFSDRFANIAAKYSFLGSATSELQDRGGFINQYFEHGRIVWNGQKFVVYKYSSNTNQSSSLQAQEEARRNPVEPTPVTESGKGSLIRTGGVGGGGLLYKLRELEYRKQQAERDHTITQEDMKALTDENQLIFQKLQKIEENFISRWLHRNKIKQLNEQKYINDREIDRLSKIVDEIEKEKQVLEEQIHILKESKKHYLELDSMSSEEWNERTGDAGQFGDYTDYRYSGEEKDWLSKKGWLYISEDQKKVYEDMLDFLIPKRQENSGNVNAGYAKDYGYWSNSKILGGNNSHTGIDIETKPGDLIHSLTYGYVSTVIDAGANSGRWVAVDEVNFEEKQTGRRWWYGHFGEVNVEKGQRVFPGSPLGKDIKDSGEDSPNTHFTHHLHLAVFPIRPNSINENGELHIPPNSVNQKFKEAVQGAYEISLNPLHEYWKYMMYEASFSAKGPLL